MRDEVIAFVVQPNNTLQTRFTIVSFVDYLGMTTGTILITQQGGGKSKIVHVATAGSLEQLITPEEALQIEELIITGTLNTSDYDFIKTMPKLKKVDLTGVSDSERRGRPLFPGFRQTFPGSVQTGSGVHGFAEFPGNGSEYRVEVLQRPERA